MRQKILSELERIAIEYDVRVLHACESGSRAWGFDSPDSDYDVRFFYVHPPEWYLSLKPEADVIELPIDDLLDIGGWDLAKALRLIKKGNVPALEWLHSPIIYQQDARFQADAPIFADQVFRSIPSGYHYISMAKTQLTKLNDQSEPRLKTYAYLLRAVLCARWITMFGTMPPLNISEVLNSSLNSPLLESEIQELLAKKRLASEKGCCDRYPAIDDFVEKEIEMLPDLLPKKEAPKSWDLFNQFFLSLVRPPA